MEILFDEIPSLDLADFTAGNPEKKAEFVRKLGEAYQNIGFVAIKNHGLSKELQDRLYSSITTFFTLPDAVKSQYEKPEIGYQRGYTVALFWISCSGKGAKRSGYVAWQNLYLP